MSDSYRSLNTDFLCSRSEEQAFEDKEGLWNENLFRQGLERDIVDKLSDGQATAGAHRLLAHKKYAKFTYLKLTGLYYAGDFTPETFDRAFKVNIFKVWNEIIYRCFFGTIYIGYDEWLLEEERRIVESQGKNWWDPSNFPKSRLRLYVMENDSAAESNIREKQRIENIKAGKPELNIPRFRSVWTNVGGIRINPERLVQCSINGMTNFIFCWQVLDEYLEGLNAYVNYFHASLKRVYVDVQDSNKAANEMGQLLSSKFPFFVLNNSNFKNSNAENDWEEFPAPDLEGNAVVMKAILAWLDERMRWLGAYGKAMGQTKERKQVGETWLDHKWVNNVRETIKLKLTAMIEELKLVFGKAIPSDLKLKVTSQEPHMDEQFKNMHNWKGDNNFMGNHFNKMKPLEGDKGEGF